MEGMGEEQQDRKPGEDDRGDGPEPGERGGLAEGAEEDVADDLRAARRTRLGKAKREGERADGHGKKTEAEPEPSAVGKREDAGVRAMVVRLLVLLLLFGARGVVIGRGHHAACRFWGKSGGISRT